MVANTSNVDNGVVKELSFIALFALIFGSMMGSGVFDIPQNIAHKSGEIAVLISWAITLIGMVAIAWAFVYITRRRPDIQTGLYGYAKHGFGNYMGFNAAWGYWLNAILGDVSYLIYIFATLGNFIVFKYFGNGNTVASLIGESILIWIIYFIILRGIRGAAVLNIMISTIKILAILIIILLFIYGFHWSIFKSNFSLDLHLGSVLTQVKSTMLVTVWDFLGIEAACIYALRAKSMKSVATATILGVVVVFLLDALISILPFGIMPSAMVSVLHTPSTAGVLAVISGSMSAQIVRVAIVISVAGALLAWTMLGVNILHLAANDKSAPKIFTKFNRHNSPTAATLFSVLVIQIFVIIAYFTQAVYLAMIQLATSLILVPYFLSALFAFKLIISDKKYDYLSLLKGTLAVAYGMWLIYAGGLKYLAFSSILYAIGSILFIIARKEQGEKIFSGIFELSMFILVVLVAIVSLVLWQQNLLVLS